MAASNCEWHLASQLCTSRPRDAKYVGAADGTTALHVAVMSCTNPLIRDGELGDYVPTPLSVIEDLLVAYPEAASIRSAHKNVSFRSWRPARRE